MSSPILNKRINNMYNTEEVDNYFNKLKSSLEDTNRKDSLASQLIRLIRTGSRYGILEKDIINLESNVSETLIQRLYYAIVKSVNYYLSNHKHKYEQVFTEEGPDVFTNVFEFKKYICSVNKYPHDKPSIVYMAHVIYLFCLGKYSKWYKHYRKEYDRYINIIQNNEVNCNA